MTQDQIGVILNALDELHVQVGSVRAIAEQGLEQGRLTNGRVSQLEVDAATAAARDDERRKMAAELAGAKQNQSTRNSRRIDRVTAACTGAGLVFLTAIVSHYAS